jgi:hypothetical protein
MVPLVEVFAKRLSGRFQHTVFITALFLHLLHPVVSVLPAIEVLECEARRAVLVLADREAAPPPDDAISGLDALNQASLLRRTKLLLGEAAVSGKPNEITLRHVLNEGWFSDALAWLLDPRGDHGLGVRFLKEFLKEIAKQRCSKGAGYARRASHLRWSKTPGRGQRATVLRLGNAASFREFYLSRGEKKSKRGDRLCPWRVESTLPTRYLGAEIGRIT